jgi:ABC transporter substrate binding protein
MRRREFIAGLGAATWPMVTRAQQGDRVRRIGMLLPAAAEDTDYQARLGVAPVHRELIITLAARYRLPGVYPYRLPITRGGLISYGPDINDQYRRAASYVDRILKGEKPADLPVQAPNKYDLVINLKTAKALGLTIPETLLATADEVIQ